MDRQACLDGHLNAGDAMRGRESMRGMQRIPEWRSGLRGGRQPGEDPEKGKRSSAH